MLRILRDAQRRLGGKVNSLVSSPFRSPSKSISFQARNSFSRIASKFDNSGSGLLFGIIGANVATYALWSLTNDNYSILQFMKKHFTLSGAGVFYLGRVHTLVTSIFSHSDGSHLLLNMITLFFFGRQAILAMGARRFAMLYFGGGLFSSLCFACWPFISPYFLPKHRRSSEYQRGLGASGAVSSVIMWSIMTWPKQIIYLYLVIPVPAAIFGLGYIALGYYNLKQGRTEEADHLGGAFYGMMFKLLRRN